ncbi:MAG: hypothetical protein HOE30_14255 [Deltaproteobacteria bacterium]|nr:hypothetical protein [Deltaproteobacteria bacterium]MBT6339004.1 hypothetical protein [Desulfobacula sp.]
METVWIIGAGRFGRLAPGVGGYRPEDLYNLSGKINRVKGSLLICTACRCHGVITGAIRL